MAKRSVAAGRRPARAAADSRAPGPRARRIASGLRPRLVAALVATSAVTLAVTTATLLAPLERRLTDAELDSIAAAAVAKRASFERLDRRQTAPGSRALTRLSESLRRRTGARVVVFLGGRALVDTGPVREEPPSGSPPPRSSRRPARAVLDADQRPQARVSLPVRLGGARGAIVLRKSLEEVTGAVATVKRAVAVAAVAGLLTALALGLALATALLRRLRRLRDAARAMGEQGLEAEAPHDPSADEIGELGRSLASMQQRLREQEAARRSFVATASHELRTPLTALGAMLELVEEELLDDPPALADARRRAAEAREQVRRLGGLADELLELSRLDAGVSLRREPVELRELCRAVLPEFAARLAGRGGPRLSLAEGEGDCWAMADPEGVARIVRILVDNAIRFSADAGRVRIACAQEDGAARLTVADSGPGVLADERELVFRRFRRGTASSGDGGFGLGLAIGRELAERMGGDLRLDEVPAGASFTLELPARGSAAEAPAFAAAPS